MMDWIRELVADDSIEGGTLNEIPEGSDEASRFTLEDASDALGARQEFVTEVSYDQAHAFLDFVSAMKDNYMFSDGHNYGDNGYLLYKIPSSIGCSFSVVLIKNNGSLADQYFINIGGDRPTYEQ